MNRTTLYSILLIIYFTLGIASGIAFSNYITSPEELPNVDAFIPQERASPYNHIKEDQIKILNNKVEITINDRQLSWARFAPTNSMDPTFDETANSIEIIPQTISDIHDGDIIAFAYKGNLIVHRVIESGYDEEGWYAITAGDNTQTPDAGKRRFEDIKYVTVGILY
jgi:hypothetical protein